MFSSNASAVSGDVNYIEDVFSTWLYKGNDSTQTITNNIDLSTEGGLVFIKNRTNAYGGFAWYDTVRGAGKLIVSNSTAAQVTAGAGKELTSFNSTGFSLGPNDNADVNLSPDNYGSWTFRKQPKFFDVVTWTGNGLSSQTVPHSLTSAPGCIMIKATSATQNWWVYHRSTGTGNYLVLNTTAASTGGTIVSATSASDFTVGSTVTSSGVTYVAYLFAHDAGGFGLAGTDNVISCGSFTTDASGNIPTTTLGYEPQWILVKPTGTTGNWVLFDNMRGLALSTNGQSILYPNLSNAEATASPAMYVNATGFSSGAWWATSTQHIYVAIRRGPMKVPTDGTTVFTPAVRTGTNTLGQTITNANFPVDLIIGRNRASAAAAFVDRLRGITYLRSDNTDAEASATNYLSSLAAQSGWVSSTGGSGFWNTSPNSYIQWYFKRAPSFFDEVCFTGTGSAVTVNHNLGAVPELMIVKSRSVAEQWLIYHSALGNTKFLYFTTGTPTTSSLGWNNTSPTSTQLTVGSGWSGSGVTLVAYLFASAPGVSKVGSYTGTGTTQQINCGFTAGSRFVLIKRTDSTGDWYVYDSARGIVAGNDPYLLLNTSDAEVTSTDYVDTYAAGFELSSTAPAALNASGGTYIFLAIA